MNIQLHSPLQIIPKELAGYLQNTITTEKIIMSKDSYKTILSFSNNTTDNFFTEIETDYTESELGEFLQKIPSRLTSKLILALGIAGFELPQLYKAALENNALEIVEKYLKNGANPNEKNEMGEAFLVDAEKNGNTALALLLLNHKADPNQWTKETYPKTPLMMALQNKQIELVEALLDRKVDPSIVGSNGQNALYSAVMGGSLPLVKKILSYQNININQKSHDETPLYIAINQGNMEMVKTLLLARANIEEAFHEYTPLMVALNKNQSEIAEYLIEQKANCTDPKALVLASIHSNVDLLQKMIERKANVNSPMYSDGGSTALMTASLHGRHGNVKKLLEQKANPRLKTSEDKTAIHFAAEQGHVDIIQMLLNNKAELDAKSQLGSALNIAVQKNHPKIVDLLLKHDADINTKMKNGEDLLSYAVHHNFPECVDLLIKKGCKLSSIDPYRLIDFSYQEGYRDTFVALLQHDPDKIKEYEDSKKNIKFKKVTVDEMQKNSGYRKMFDNIYRETAARIFQRQWRKRHPSDYKIKYSETLKNPLSMRFIQEPAGFKSEEHAKKIKAGEWLAMDYKDPEFERNLYKILRQKRITVREMATAYFLYQAKDIFKDDKRTSELKQYSYDEKGPYSPDTISYSTNFRIDNFKASLKYLPKHERGYFGIDFSRKFELVFFCDGLKHGLYLRGLEKFQELMGKFIKKLPLSEEEKTNLLNDYTSLIGAYNTEKTDKFIDKVLSCYPDLKEFYLQKPGIDTERETPRLLVATLAVGDQDPCVELSPNYDENNPESPVVCKIIPTIASFNALQFAMHGSDSTDPFFTAGQVSTRLIRKLDETEYVIGMSKQARPVELQHPDLVLTPSPHELSKVHASQVSGHDMFHCWRNGAITIKPIIRYLRNLHESVKGYDMSKYIWNLTDMDMGAGRSARLAYKNYGSWEGWEGRSYWINDIVKTQPNDFYYCSDSLFITLIDMIKNEKQWIEFYGKSLKKNFEYEKRVLEFMTEMKAIIEKYPDKSTLFYILAYRLQVRFRRVQSIPEGKEPLEIPNDTIIAETDGKLVTAFWRDNNGIHSKTLSVADFENFQYLPKVDEATLLPFLIKSMITKFGCTPYRYEKAEEVLQKFADNPKMLDELFMWDRNGGIQFLTPVIERNLEKLNPSQIIDYCERFIRRKERENSQEIEESPQKKNEGVMV